jgi:hypothetical protein
MFEHHRSPLLTKPAFMLRLLKHFFVSFVVLAISLGLGTLGYHLTENLPWIDALFASFYALFSGVIFLSLVAILLAPLVHRFLHKFHLGIEDK